VSEQVKPSPGPWTISKRPDPDEVKEAYDDREEHVTYVCIDSPKWACFAMVHVFCQGDPDEQGEANARLIVAAPDLLAALQGMVGLIDVHGWGEGPALRAARAAISKAEGK
jgi:hypothetical protein